MELELRHLRVVRAIADQGTLTSAARELGMTQPSVSENLRRAERAVGGRLFHRDVHGARPTPLGEVVAAHAGTVMNAVDRMTAATTRHHAGVLPPVVRVHCTPGTLVAHLSVAVPDVTGCDVEISTGAHPGRPLELLAGRRSEAALLTCFPDPRRAERAVSPEGTRRSVVAREPVFVGVSADHRLAGRREVHLAELAEETWCVDPGPHHELTDHLVRSCRDTGYRPTLRACDHTEGLQLVEMGRAVMPFAPSARPREGLVCLALRGTPLRMTTALYWHPLGPLAGDRVQGLWERLVRAQHDIVERTPRYRAWLERHPDWRTTPRAMETTSPHGA
ncbi:LysR family transcriptional regulator [Streptomyces chumphonensis]|uniref:LysR family transcriptional regulator n=1 Tax=Streptomyces chumphonensis TaxID=1214925 RepID=A0A927EVA6_9ACTN|nr:LysR family transcriptional regulator [Streptomyces chumphonensis]MBD3930415.1 LysR family transcriptional regulator [Streptomyces chumphonensis]